MLQVLKLQNKKLLLGWRSGGEIKISFRELVRKGFFSSLFTSYLHIYKVYKKSLISSFFYFVTKLNDLTRIIALKRFEHACLLMCS